MLKGHGVGTAHGDVWEYRIVMNIIWMAVSGGMIGMVTSMFVKGSRTVGLVWTIVIGAVSYGVSGMIVSVLGGPVLLQWVVAVAATMFLLTLYILVANRKR